MYVHSSVVVGRDQELAAVEQALVAARGGVGGAVFLVGESGIGKTRLSMQAAGMTQAAGMRLLRGRSSTIGPTVPFRALTEALLSGLRAGRVDEAALGTYRPVLGRLVPDWASDTPEGSGDSLVVLAEGVLRLTAQLGSDRGCLIVLDDLQDADADTLAVLEYLVDNLEHQPTLLVGTIRSEPSPALDLARSAARRRTCRLLELRRLDRREVGQVAVSCLEESPGTIPEELVDQLYADSAGIPFVAEELLKGMIDNGSLVLGAGGWQLSGGQRTAVPLTVARTVADRAELLGADGRLLLLVAAVLGRRFPLSVVQAVTGLDDHGLLRHLLAARDAQLVRPDEVTPDWYAFAHPLAAEALLALLSPGERTAIARNAADAIGQLHPGLPGDWCQLAAALRVDAGEPGAAAALLAQAAKRALAQGAAKSAVAVLERARELLTGADESSVRAEVLESLLYALAEAGYVERALECADALEELAGLDAGRRASLHIRLAWAAYYALRTVDSRAHVDAARAVLGPDPVPAQTAQIDAVEAYLLLFEPGRDRTQLAEAMARRAAAAAEAAGLPVVACQAWQLVGVLARRRDLDEATACLERAWQLANQHQLPIQEIYALIRYGADDGLRYGEVERIERALRQARRVGAVVAGYLAEGNLCLQVALRGEFDQATALIDQMWPSVSRLKITDVAQYLLFQRAMIAGHRGDRKRLEEALAELRRWGGERSQYAPLMYGLARAVCALLEEDHDRARADLDRALALEDENPTIFHLAGRYGLDLLLRVLRRQAGWPEYEAVLAMPSSGLRWNDHFMLLARAVLLGRDGGGAEAAAAVQRAGEVGSVYAMARHLGLRLVAEAALEDGWGAPVGWLQGAEEYFHQLTVPAVASACRALLRRSGTLVPQRRDGVDRVPTELRSLGVTVREYEILQLVVDRLGNRLIAERLGISPRTVEKHVASLITKTGQPHRNALSEHAARILAT